MSRPEGSSGGSRGSLTGSPQVQRARRFTATHPLGRMVVPAVAIALVLLYPYWYDTGAFSWLTLDILGLKLDIVIVMLVYVMLALGLNIVVGYAGLLDLGYVAFYALGAYTVGWFASSHFNGLDIHFGSIAPEGTPGIHLGFWFLIPIAGLVTALAGVIIGWPTLRLRGDYLAIVTLGFGEIIPDAFRNANQLPIPSGFRWAPPFIDFQDHNITNGVAGITALDRPGFGTSLNDLTNGALPDRFGGLDLKPWFYTIVIMVLFTIFVNRRLRDSKMGRAWIAVREDEIAASAMGVPLMRTKLWAYGIGAVFGGFAGCFYGSFIGNIFPTSFFFNISVLILCMVIVGGMGNIAGVVVGALLLEYLNLKGLDKIGERVNDGIDAVGINSAIDIPKYKFLIFGTLLVVMMLFRPEGLIPSARRKAELQEGEGTAVLYDVST
ncbi:MAG: branched-chain amino acid ABC transporter permease [Gaiellaceae bacterium]